MRDVLDESKYLDPVFASVGMQVYSNEYIEMLRAENLELKRKGRRSYNLIPQAGFQEQVLVTDADIKIIGGSRGGGKMNPVDTLIVTPHGYKRLGDLKVGNYITDPCTGSWEKVIQIYEHPHKDIYEVTFDDGATCECGLEHLWKARFTGLRRRCDSDTKGWRIYTFEQIKQFLDEQAQGKHRDRGTKDHILIPLCEPVKFSCRCPIKTKMPKLDPYIIGAILGDGCITETQVQRNYISFVSNDMEIVDEFVKAGIDMSSVYPRRGTTALQYRIRDERISKIIELTELSGTSSATKFIPDVYKWGTVEERFAILQGLMDTDGSVNAGGKCLFITISKQLAEDVRFIVESLGGVATIKERESYYLQNGIRYPAKNHFELYIKLKNPSRMFRLPRKKDACTEFNGGVSDACRRIVSYRYVGKKDARCITVDSINRLYMTKDFVVTHNTFVSLFGALDYSFNPDINMYGFRRLEADVKRGIYRSAKQTFRGFASFADTSFEVKFFGGTGATMKMEHLADLKQVKDRFRGAEMPYIVIEELAEFTRENMNVIFDLISSNRSTTGMPSQFICTCNPVGKSNKLRHFLDWWIDPDTDTIIPERSGKIRYFCRYGEDVMEIAWGNSPEEVYANPSAHRKIASLTDSPDEDYRDYITSVVFIEGDYADNKILHVTDPKYMNRISSGGSKSTINDIRGIWRDVEEGGSLLTIADMEMFFANSPQQRGRKVAAADIALKGDASVLMAADGFHIVDVEAVAGLSSEELIARIEGFLDRNQVAKEDFTFDTNGIGNFVRESEVFKDKAIPFDNRAAARNKIEYKNLKSECLGNLIDLIQREKISIDPALLSKRFTRHGNRLSLREYLLVERLAAKWKREENPKEMIDKREMKTILGGVSPDFLETLLYLVSLMSEEKARGMHHTGFNAFIRGFR